MLSTSYTTYDNFIILKILSDDSTINNDSLGDGQKRKELYANSVISSFSLECRWWVTNQVVLAFGKSDEELNNDICLQSS